MSKFNLKVGDEITCPTCHKVMVVCAEIPKQNSKNWAHCFKSVNFKSVSGAKPLCPFDGTIFLNPYFGGMHTEKYGWTW